jgi:predicted nucleic-acid-binding protein
MIGLDTNVLARYYIQDEADSEAQNLLSLEHVSLEDRINVSDTLQKSMIQKRIKPQ